MAKEVNIQDYYGKTIILRRVGAKRYTKSGRAFAYIIFAEPEKPDTDLVGFATEFPARAQQK